MPDERLRLIFTCCHPALAHEAQVALTLRTLCGLTTDEIARAFLVPATTMAQRLVRAKAQDPRRGDSLSRAGGGGAARAARGGHGGHLSGLQRGLRGDAGRCAVRRELCAEAIGSARMLRALLPAPRRRWRACWR